jgi:protease I
MTISGKTVAILATHGFEHSELEVPRDKLKAAGATVHVVSLEAGEIQRLEREGLGPPGQGRPQARRRFGRRL